MPNKSTSDNTSANPTKGKPDHLKIFAEADKVDEETARVLSEPETRAAAIIQKFEGDTLEINSLIAELHTQTAAVQVGNMSRAESILMAQAHSLDALFSNLSRRAHGNIAAGHGEAAERYLKLALKAQAQAVRTIAALGELKNPKHIAFVAQANISNGHQQVNNSKSSQEGKQKSEPNKLSAEVNDELLPNQRASGAKSRIDQAMETVGKVHRR